MNTVTEKNSLRKLYKKIRHDMVPSEAKTQSEKILAHFFALEEYKSAENILTYVSHDNEVDTKELINRALSDKKSVAVPKVYGDVIKFHKISGMDDLEEGAFGILEPKSGSIFNPRSGIIVVPGLVFDEERHRIGYGGGFYDKYLKSHPGLISIALCYDYQIISKISCEEHDIKPDIILASGGYLKKD